MEAQHLCAYLLYHVCREEKIHRYCKFYADFVRLLFSHESWRTIDDFLKYKEKSAAGKNPSGAESAKAVLCGEDNK